jgi:uncharacterized protein (TIGR01244 family)
MKIRLFPLIALLGIAAFSFAGETAVDAAVSIKAADIKADASLLDGHSAVSSGQPDSEVLAIVSAAGYTTVIDLRGASEDRGMDEPAAVAALGMTYISLPVAGVAGVTFENAAEFDKILAATDGKVFLHCASGNRVGAMYALRAKMTGATDEEALALGKAAGMTRLEAIVKERMQNQ